MIHLPFKIPLLHPSHRIHFQLYYANQVPNREFSKEPNILNVGCADDPVGLGDKAHHFDMDDWSYKHRWFTQGDAHELPFEDNSFYAVFLGDILEHAIEPFRVVREALRVCSHVVVLTIFEEWRLPDIGLQIHAGQVASDRASQALGYSDRMDAQAKMYPEKVSVDDETYPHLCHIWQFDDDYIEALMFKLSYPNGVEVKFFEKKAEAHYAEDDHEIYNWLVCLEKTK